jgi:hypothetical protein
MLTMEISRHWRLKAQRYRLVGSLCLQCGQVSFPPHPLCLHCSDRQAHGAGFEPLILQAPHHMLENTTPERMIS